MANETETFVIDSEFALFGPMGFDVGLLLANFVLNWVMHTVLGNMKYAVYDIFSL